METNSPSFQYEAWRVGVEGHFAIVAVMLTILVGLAGFLAGRKRGWW